MTSSELVTARLEANLSISEFAEALGVPESKVADWESGAARIPRHTAQMLSWLAALKRRERAIEAARLPECAWANEWDSRPDSDDDDELSREQDEWDAHTAGCSVCQARESYIATHLGPVPPFPESRTMAVFTAIERRLDTVPAWTHPALLLATVGFAVPAFEWGRDAVWWLIGRSNQPPMTIGSGLPFVVMLSAGAGALGLVYGGGKELFRRAWGQATSGKNT